MSSRMSQFIRNTRSGAALVSAVVVLVFLAGPVYFALEYRNDHQRHMARETEHHLKNRIAYAQALIDRAKTVPGIVAATVSQAGSAPRFESTIRNILGMSGIVESVNIVSTYGPATVVRRNAQDQEGVPQVFFRPASTLVVAKKPVVGLGDGTLLIREALSETDSRGHSRFWGYLTAEASLADLIQELQLLALVKDGFGVKFGVDWQSRAGETVIFTGGDFEGAGVSRSIPLAGNALLTLTVVPPTIALAGFTLMAATALAIAAVLLFLLTFYLLRRPQMLEREVEARTREIAAEKAALKKEITARTKAESHLERSHALLDSIFEHIPGMIVLKRVSDRRIARINSSGERILGRARDFLIGRCNDEIYAPDLADFLARSDTEALASPGLIELPVRRIEMPAADPRWIAFRKTVLRDREGAAQYILEFGEDVTERENLDRRLREQLTVVEQAERRVARLNRVLTVLSEINHLIIYTRERGRLLEEAHRILREEGEFPAVWIHVKDDGGSRFIATEAVQAHVERICGEIENPQRRCWPEKRLHCKAVDCCDPALAEELRQIGLQALIHLPLRSGDVEWGGIGIMSPIGQSFSAEEQSLLEELAGNLSFALDAMRIEEQRRAAESKFELAARVFDNNSEGIIVTDAANRILMVNKAFTTVTGYDADEVMGRTPDLLSSGRHNAQFFGQMWDSLEQQGEWRGEVINRRKNGEHFPEWLTISQVRNEVGAVSNYVAVFSDLTARRKIEARLDFLAHYDSLTSLPNRDHFNERLDALVAESQQHGKRLAVVHFDLDRFKFINETIGHVAGDQLLIEVASRLLSEVKSKRDVARLGGDQFALLIPDIDSSAQAAQFVRRIQDKLGKPFLHFLQEEIHMSASIGISVFPEDGADAHTLALNADSAMYKAIEEGGNTYRFFHQEMNERAAVRVQIESRLHHALERGELDVHFQPFVAAADGRIVGAEALLRWHCPELGGDVSPATFIPLIEETGLVHKVGEWVLARACEEVRRWQALGAGKLFVAVNISALQLTHELPRMVRETLAANGIAPDCLEIELTESALMRDADHGIRMLHELKALGVQLSIDDFGTGHSSLSYLKRLPMGTLKIDRSFVIDTPDDAEAVSITRAILALGHSLHLNIIAEGVETAEQVEFLRHNGCDLLQGYYFSRPVDAAAFSRLLAESPVFPLPSSGHRAPALQLLGGKHHRLYA